ncbi:MAG: transposase family protein, partial [Anaplasma sp.]|nr:transposase family protein [Anaplasma sp.]
MMRPVPDHAWYRVGVDIFECARRSYLCAYDALSNFPEVELLRDTSAATVIDKLSAMFARYGIPVEVCTDGGPQFTSREFASFAENYDFKHTTSSPGFPRSNGLAEKGVQVVKRILKKTTEGKNDFWLGLLNYRSSPLEDGKSPGELLQGRRLRTPIPDFNEPPRAVVTKHQQT